LQQRLYAFDYFRRRIIAVGSFIIATRPLTEAEIGPQPMKAFEWPSVPEGLGPA
jgi:hypothetical protein